jgi:hypothetical protein
MKKTFRILVATVVVACLSAINGSSAHATISFVGSHYDMVNLYPGGAPPYVVSPWRSEGTAKPLDIDANNVYGTDGYALFATQFAWPNPGCCGSSVPVDSATWPNMIDLPSYVSDSKFLVTNKVGGWNYALIDDPTLVNGYRDYNWGDTQSPPVVPEHSQSPYVKMGNIEGTDIMGNSAKAGVNGAGRWAFTLGADVPNTIRVSVMSDGYDDVVWTATEVKLAKIDSTGAILDIVGSGTLQRNRMVDMHLFDIVGGQPGDSYAIFAKATATGLGQGAIAGVAFDSRVPEPTGLALLLAGVAAFASLPKRHSAR